MRGGAVRELKRRFLDEVQRGALPACERDNRTPTDRITDLEAQNAALRARIAELEDAARERSER